ncbi:polysaccharide pyruvyl transferase family protein [Cloacibacterium sp.]|uniref:polysaccharide pyruvyl transferase family protein n=1 Tax=Cloacibacterium sp. TaxID=1913682 RepID=UPI0039E3A8E3
MKILLFLHGGSLNRGCEAIIRTAVAEIKTQFPNAIIDLASYEPETDIHLKQVNKVFVHLQNPPQKYSWTWLKSAFFVKFFNTEKYHHRYTQKDIISKINNYEVFISVGGDNYCYGEQPGFYEINHLIKKANKKLVLWGASVGQEDLSPAKIEDLKRFDLILARETLTEEVLKNAGCQKVKLVADGAFLMEKTELPLPEGFLENKTVGFNFSPLIFSRNKKSKEAAFKLIKHILETTDYHVALIPHVTIKISNDYKTLKKFLEKFKNTKRVFLLPDNLNATEYKGYISRLKFFIGARTHATIAAYSSGVPTMVLGYSIKSKGIAKDLFGEEKLVLGIDEISDAQKLIAKFEEMKQDEEWIKEMLKNRIPEIKEMSKKAKEYFAEIL